MTPVVAPPTIENLLRDLLAAKQHDARIYFRFIVRFHPYSDSDFSYAFFLNHWKVIDVKSYSVQIQYTKESYLVVIAFSPFKSTNDDK